MPGDEKVRRYLARKRERERLEAERADSIKHPGKRLKTRRRAEYYILEAAYTWADTLQPAHGPNFGTLLSSAVDDVYVHLPFNPDEWSVMQGQTVGGLQKVGPPDFWNPSVPPEFRKSTCEGYVLRQHGVVARADLEDYYRRMKLGQDTGYDKMVPYQISGMRSRLYENLDVFAGFREDEPLRALYRKHREELELLTEEDLLEVVADLRRQVAKLHKLYETAVFWFLPHSERGNKETDTWLAQTRPKLGQERPLKVDFRCYLGTGEIVPFSEEWCHMGMWQMTAFPQAVAWLKQWVRQARKEMASGWLG